MASRLLRASYRMVKLMTEIELNEKITNLLSENPTQQKQSRRPYARENRVKKDDRLLRIIQRYYIPHAGYVDCGFDSTIAKLYRKESDVLQGYCQSHAASVFFKDRFIGISTPISDWRIIPSGKGNEVVLYHKNTLGDKKTGPVPGYHLQWVSQNTISGYLEYISDHDLYRNMHPLYPVQSKKNSPPPMKGTKRYRKEQKRAAKKARRQSIAHVLTLIENLDTQARVARSM